MKISSSVIHSIDTQADGRLLIVERHVGDNGETYDITRLAPVGYVVDLAASAETIVARDAVVQTEKQEADDRESALVKLVALPDADLKSQGLTAAEVAQFKTL